MRALSTGRPRACAAWAAAPQALAASRPAARRAPRRAEASLRFDASAPIAGLAAGALALAAPLAAFADEAPALEAAAALDAAGDALVLSPSTAAIALSPVIAYGIFFLYREKVNPRATLGDGLFVIAALVILANIISILVFKIRLF
jgi:hypothetical protein